MVMQIELHGIVGMQDSKQNTTNHFVIVVMKILYGMEMDVKNNQTFVNHHQVAVMDDIRYHDE